MDATQKIERIVAVAVKNGYTLSATKRVAEQNLGGALDALEMHFLETSYYQKEHNHDQPQQTP